MMMARRRGSRAWFGSVKAALEAGARGKKAVLQVKTNQGLYPKDYIDKAFMECQGVCGLFSRAIIQMGKSWLQSGIDIAQKQRCFLFSPLTQARQLLESHMK